MTRHFIVATAGHVDHGKSALVKALSGTDPDRLPEEKARGITIDLGFAHLQLPAADPSTTFDLGIIDMPGHEDFVKNMVAGAGCVDLALLLVAADDGWMPQTEEHLQILTYLGVQRGVVVLTKTDLCEHEESARIALIRQKLRGSPFEQAPIIPTSVMTGRGLDELRVALAEQLASVPSPKDLGKPRLPIDRAFVLQGIGRVVAGTLRGGCLQAGQEVLIQPAGATTRIRAIQTYNHEVKCAGPGTRTALNLANVSLGSDGGSGAGGLVVQRGCVVTLPGLGSGHHLCDLLLERSPRLLADHTPAARPLRDGTRVRFHIGSGNVPGRLYFSGRPKLAAGERCLAQIRLESPVYAFAGDRFVIRDWAEQLTLAGGFVLDPGASRKSRAFLGRTSSASPSLPNPGAWVTRSSETERVREAAGLAVVAPQLVLAKQLQSHRVLRKSALLVQSNFSAAEVANALSDFTARGSCAQAGDWVLGKHVWDALRERAQALVDACHQAHPEQTGLSLAELRAALGGQLPVPEVFEPLLAELLRTGFAQVGSVIQRAGHRPQLPVPLQPAGAGIRSALALKPLEPPSRKELAPDRASQEALAFLVRTGEVIELGSDLVLSAAAFARAAETIRQFLRQHGAATVSELRQALGASRRVVIPLLEKLDRQGLTRREEDKRLLKAAANSSS